MLFCNLPSLFIEWVVVQSFPFLLIKKPNKHKLLFAAASTKNADAWLIHEGHHHWAFFFFFPFRKLSRNSSDYAAQIQYRWTSRADRKSSKTKLHLRVSLSNFQFHHLNKNLAGNKRWACTEPNSAICMSLKHLIL